MIKRERVYPVTVYFNRDEFTRVRRLAKQVGLSLSDVVRLSTLYVMNEVLIAQSFVTVMNKATEQDERGE
jgi:hypothetical protein